MSVVIRLARGGRKKLPYYRIVVTDKEMPRDGRFLEMVGTLNPRTEPATFSVKEDRIKYWIGVGATPSDTVSQFLEKAFPGYLTGIEEDRLKRIRSRRAQRKARVAASGTKPAKAKKEKKAKKAPVAKKAKAAA